ncbi:META domain-containing protein [Streptomyces sp. NBC_01275]|uniref:META domain-containing protein n=1 Tax=Streptomyces sp. NBC_01275 TaxID=2903807 RepID=UPI002250D5A0|nr:META domain-containing protein [Streptomyces sp. NBC_01275]MCX4763230.1 META domain-containing protein [Streptomyces sp. NBC_01275]
MYRDRYRGTYRQRTLPAVVAVTVVVLGPLGAACGGERADGEQPGSAAVSPAQPVTGVRWNVVGVTVDGTAHRAPDGAHVEIEDGRAAGSYGCNHFNAKAVVEGDRIRFSDARSTRMACADEPMEFERTLSRTLAEGTLTAEVGDATLTLSTTDGDQVRLTAE